MKKFWPNLNKLLPNTTLNKIINYKNFWKFNEKTKIYNFFIKTANFITRFL